VITFLQKCQKGQATNQDKLIYEEVEGGGEQVL